MGDECAVVESNVSIRGVRGEACGEDTKEWGRE